MTGFKQKRISHARANSLVRYFHRHFYPDKLADKSPHTPTQYERAVTKLCQYAARDITIGEINERILDRFAEWCITSGIAYETARKYRAYVRAIVRHARPGMCPKQSGRRPHEEPPGDDPEAELKPAGSLWEFFETKYRRQRLAGGTEGQGQQIEIAMRRLCKQLGRAAMLADLTDELIREHQAWMLDDGYSPKTVNSACGHLLSVWRFAYQLRAIQELPRVARIREYQRLPVAWKLDEFERLLDATNTRRGMYGDVPAAQWWRALLLVVYDTAIRCRAVLSIERCHLDIETGWLMVPAENMKARVEQRFKLSDQTTEAVRAIWFPRRRFLFPHKSRNWFHRNYGRLLEAAGLPRTARDQLHKIRRTTASIVAKEVGIAAAVRLLGHSTETVTKNYIDPTFISTHEVVESLPRPVTTKGGAE